MLDGLLYHQTGLRIEEHYTDTGGVTDHVFGLCPLFGFRFAPRIRDLRKTDGFTSSPARTLRRFWLRSSAAVSIRTISRRIGMTCCASARQSALVQLQRPRCSRSCPHIPAKTGWPWLCASSAGSSVPSSRSNG